MIRTIIFDFGDVFINLDKQGALKNAIELFQLKEFTEDLVQINNQYEKGEISTDSFIEFYLTRFPKCNKQDIINAWNYILKDFPPRRLDFLNQLKALETYNLILLSNTNEMHIDYIKRDLAFYDEFKSHFDKFYLSHEIGMRKPNSEIYEFVLEENNLIAEECLFIDDTKENTDSAEILGIHTWNIDETKEDVIDLFKIKSSLF